ncbi:hypothetical protein INR49_027108 [Caranx melampygus]|nr:hypothetical protein INR49_027108 [Caranx melampygus]
MLKHQYCIVSFPCPTTTPHSFLLDICTHITTFTPGLDLNLGRYSKELGGSALAGNDLLEICEEVRSGKSYLGSPVLLTSLSELEFWSPKENFAQCWSCDGFKLTQRNLTQLMETLVAVSPEFLTIWPPHICALLQRVRLKWMDTFYERACRERRLERKEGGGKKLYIPKNFPQSVQEQRHSLEGVVLFLDSPELRGVKVWLLHASWLRKVGNESYHHPYIHTSAYSDGEGSKEQSPSGCDGREKENLERQRKSVKQENNEVGWSQCRPADRTLVKLNTLFRLSNPLNPLECFVPLAEPVERNRLDFDVFTVLQQLRLRILCARRPIANQLQTSDPEAESGYYQPGLEAKVGENYSSVLSFAK